MIKSGTDLNDARTAPIKSAAQSTYTISRRARYWEVVDPAGNLVCLTVYKCGAKEVVRRLSA